METTDVPHKVYKSRGDVHPWLQNLLPLIEGQMNLKLFVDALSMPERHELSAIIYEKNKLNARERYAKYGVFLSPEAIILVREGKTIEAIKLYRSLHGCSLMEAKAAIDYWQETGRQSKPSIQSL